MKRDHVLLERWQLDLLRDADWPVDDGLRSGLLAERKHDGPKIHIDERLPRDTVVVIDGNGRPFGIRT